MNRIRRTGLPSLFASLAVLAIGAPSGASAATTVGQTVPSNGGTCFGPPSGGVQLTTLPSNIYTIPFDGVITSFSATTFSPFFPTTDTEGTPIKLLILRFVDNPLIGVVTYNVVAKSNFETFSGSVPHPFPTLVPVQAGQVIGEYGAACFVRTGEIGDTLGVFAGSEPALGADRDFQTGGYFTGLVRVNLSASLEPDADHDGFGDETQDCPTNPATAGPCPTTAAAPTGQRVAAQKKCMKKKPKKVRKKCQKKAKRLPV